MALRIGSHLFWNDKNKCKSLISVRSYCPSVNFCLEVHRKSGGSPAEVQWTENLANITGFCLSPSDIQWKSGGSPAEVQRTQNSGQSNHFLLLGGLSGLSLDFGWTSSGIQSCSTDFRRTVRWVRRKWQGPTKVRQSPLDKQWECKVLSLGMILHKLLFFKLPYRWVISIGFSALWGIGIDEA